MKPLAIVTGARTPFAKAHGPLAGVPAQQLGRIAVQEAIRRAAIPADRVDQVIIGNVVGPADASNIARVISLMAGVPQDRIAHTVNRNCASGMEAITDAWLAIEAGRAEVIVAGGVESMSRIPLLWSEDLARILIDLQRSRSWWSKLRALARVRPRHLKPVVGVKLGLTDPVSGMLMGATAELLAREFAIGRDEQDRFALESHRRAVAAQDRCSLAAEIVPVPGELTEGQPVAKDVGPRADQTLEKLARLAPFFDPEHGTVTVGNSCPITDGAAAVVVMPVERARALGHEPLGRLSAYAYAGLDPARMGLGPVYATAKLLRQTGLGLKDIEFIEINEAFAAQVIANQRAFSSDRFARERLGLDRALGDLDPAITNVNGGAIALGHPVGATGTRLVITLLKEMQRRGLHRGLATLCVGGGQGAALLLERD